ncbi:MAG: polyprenyl synthetase family protein [Acidobacteriota bacterium]
MDAVARAIDRLIASVPHLDEWPTPIDRREALSTAAAYAVWRHPIASCLAMRGEQESALPVSAGVFCSLVSIHLVDDILDDDEGLHTDLGPGRVANFALALQAAPSFLVGTGAFRSDLENDLRRRFAALALDTAYGQALDAEPVRDEADYWRVVTAKTPPLFREALAMGARVGGASGEQADAYGRVGTLLAKIIQIGDDLRDTLQRPAAPDWHQGSHNLAILYALVADHPDRQRFTELLPDVVADPEALRQAQAILTRCGAATYCIYQIVDHSQQLEQAIIEIAPPDPEPLHRLARAHMTSLSRVLEQLGVELPYSLHGT